MRTSPSQGLQLNYGLRLDGNWFPDSPGYNAALDQALGARNDATPSRWRVSPRLGFAYHHGVTQEVAVTEGAARAPAMTVRGGFGIFQGIARASSLLPAVDHSGLPDAARDILCIGAAAPTPDWTAYAVNTAAIPGACADGSSGTVFASGAPSVILFARDFQAPRSVRSNLQWSGRVLGGRFNTTADVTYSRNLQQPGAVDLNFAPNVGFALASEGGRPVFVPETSIVPASGAVAFAASRRSPEFGRVTALGSDLESEATQLSLMLSPTGFRPVLSWNIGYVYSRIRDQANGFASTGGDPRAVAWGRSALDSRHHVVYSLGYSFLDALRLTWSGSIRSGAPYTPMVSGDVNGDGAENDRAFVRDPSSFADTEAASAMSGLLTGSNAACLRRQLGAIAARNSCEGPWTSTASLTVGLNPVRWWKSNRLDVLFQVSNPLGAADLLLHGSNGLRGWGQFPAPDQTLYYVRGFDPSAKEFVYEVNPRFGSTAPSQSTARTPVVMTAIVRFDVGPTRERQTLLQQLDRGRSAPGARLSETAIRNLYGAGGLFNPLSAILRVADSLELTAFQADSLTALNRTYTRQLETIWAPIAARLAALPIDYNRDEAYRIYVDGRRQSVDLLSALAGHARGMLTGAQMRALPAYATAHLDPRYLATIRSGTAGLGLAYLPGLGAPRGSAGGSGGMAMPIRR